MAKKKMTAKQAKFFGKGKGKAMAKGKSTAKGGVAARMAAMRAKKGGKKSKKA